jgi:ABC-2 type transport system ATP-binding protein
MDTETLVLYLHQPLTQLLPTGKYVIRQIDDLTLEADLSSQENLNDLFNWLSQYQIEIKSMRNKSNRLEQLFVSKVLSQTPMPTVSKVSP